MYIDRILAPITSLGPGNRLVIWTKGCSKHCEGCANPELWSLKQAKNYSCEDVLTIIKNVYTQVGFDGITISGGDPLEQKEELLKLLQGIRQFTEDVLIYTGYTIEEVKQHFSESEFQELTDACAVLIDGPYVQEQNRSELVLRGSANQNIIYFKEKMRDSYEAYLLEGRKIQNVFMREQMISVGIHNA